MALQRAQRVLWIGGGYVFAGIGFAGVFLPVLPGVPFLLLAAFCFSRGSERLHQALLAHPRLGPPIIAWRDYGVIPKRAKTLAIILMASSFGLTWWMGVAPLALALQGTVLLCVAIFLVTRPSTANDSVAARGAAAAAPAIPPNQQVTSNGKWPVVGEKAPRRSDEPWTVEVAGLVAAARRFTLDELRALGEEDVVVDIHCVTRWSRPASRFRGVRLAKILAVCGPLEDARFVSFVARSDRQHSTSLKLDDVLGLDPIFAFEHDDGPLDEIHGGPVRMVVPGRYFYKSVKWLERIELMAIDRLGFWEAEAGYHNDADPWLEQRYAVANFDRRAVAELFQSRDFSGKDLRSLRADGQAFAGLKAQAAALRDASFCGANLEGACFDGANLSNARLVEANLRNASFGPFEGQPADLEGADLRGADLRGARLSGVSLFGATFVASDAPDAGAIIDATTEIDAVALASLDATLGQLEYVRRALGRS